VGEIHSSKLLTTPELRGGGLTGNCSEKDVNADGEVVGFSMGRCRLGLYEYIST